MLPVHGMKAGTLVSMMKSLFTANSIYKSLEEFFTTSNNALKNSKLDKMMMAFAMVNIYGQKIKIANAGIPPIYIYRKHKMKLKK
ncbi:MAG: SpoIIE family protein phosphatase [Melioribacteraceae bacterium]|nr:SpoIIE family protein phosphatase [Melioribacteraceae bacterium]